jgi:hypothetical protein
MDIRASSWHQPVNTDYYTDCQTSHDKTHPQEFPLVYNITDKRRALIPIETRGVQRTEERRPKRGP